MRPCEHTPETSKACWVAGIGLKHDVVRFEEYKSAHFRRRGAYVFYAKQLARYRTRERSSFAGNATRKFPNSRSF